MNWWPCVPRYSPANKPPLVQDCHGAAGIVCRLAPLPRGVPDAETWDLLLLQAGELTWRAGPLAKGVAFCHGTAGSAHAFLHLFARTGDERWLAGRGPLRCTASSRWNRNARRTARAAIRYGTGDLGTAGVLVGLDQGDRGSSDAGLLLTEPSNGYVLLPLQWRQLPPTPGMDAPEGAAQVDQSVRAEAT